MVRVAACDVGDAADALTLPACAASAGVLHAAGVLRDGLASAQHTRSVSDCAAPKASGAAARRPGAPSAPLRRPSPQPGAYLCAAPRGRGARAEHLTVSIAHGSLTR